MASLQLMYPSLFDATTLPLSISLGSVAASKIPLVIGRGTDKAVNVQLQPNSAALKRLHINPNKPLLSRRHAVCIWNGQEYALLTLGRVWIGQNEQERRTKIVLRNNQQLSFGHPSFCVTYVVRGLQSSKMADLNQIALGTLGLSVLYPLGTRPSRTEALGLLHAAIVEHNVRFLDTADSYCGNASDFGYAEQLVGECLAGLPVEIRSKMTVATKGGMERYGSGLESGKTWKPSRMTPQSLRGCIAASRSALRCETIDLWQLHHADGNGGESSMFAELLIAANEAVEAGEVKAIGLCNCSTDHVRVAYEILGDKLQSVSNCYSLFDRSTEKPDPKSLGKNVAKSNKHGVLALCQELDLTFLAYAPLGGLQIRDGRRNLLKSFPKLASIATSHGRVGVSGHLIALAWMRQKWKGTLVPLVGMRSRAHLTGLEKLDEIILTEEEMLTIDGLRDEDKKRKRT
jgi:aryl-alcohol dehydrogenase-like predicted oxidoreductase